MTDSTSWQAPGGSPEVPPAPTPAYGPPAPAAYGPPTLAAPPAPPGPPLGWTPPPKPGLIPLRPLTLGTLLGASFQVLRRNPRPMFGFSLLLTGAVSIVTVLVVGVFTFWGITRISTAVEEDVEAIAAGGVATIILGTFIPLALSIAVLAILQGVVVLEVARGTVGEKLPLRGLLRAARGRIWALIGWALLATAVVTAALVVVVLIIVLLASFGGPAGIGFAVALGILGALGALVLGAWLWTRLCLVPIAIVIERLPLRQAMRRSWSLTLGFFWKTFGIQLLVAVILSGVSQIVSLPLSFVLMLTGSLMNPQGDDSAGIVVFLVFYILTLVISVVIAAISAVVQSAATALIYIDIRMRKEGLDLELSKFVEARQAGDTSVADPYLPRQPAPASA